jgi:O-antigen ligase
VRRLLLFFPSLYLFALPFAHVTSLRSIGFVGTLCLLAWILVRERPFWLPLKAPLALWLLAAGLSLFWSVDPRYSADELKGDLLYGIATFYAFFLLTQNAGDLFWWRRVTAASMALLGLLALLSYMQHGKWADGYHNFIGEYATFVLTALPLLFTTFLAGPLRASRNERALTGGAIALGLCGGLVAKSRAFWAVICVTGIAIAALIAARGMTSMRKAAIGVAALVVIAAVALGYGTSVRGIPLDYFTDRLPIYKFSVAQIAEHPLGGSGFGRQTNREAYRQHFPGGGFLHPHSLPLGYAEQMGVLGLIALGWLFGAMAHAFWRAWRSEFPDVATAGLAGLALLIAVALKNIPDMFFSSHLLLLFLAHAGLLLGYVEARLRARSADAR